MTLKPFVINPTLLLLLLWGALAQADPHQRTALDEVAFHQRLGETLPAATEFVNAQGDPIRLTALARERPLILVLSWFNCPNLCPMVLDHLAASTSALDLPRADYAVAVVSIAPDESAEDALRIQQALGRRQGDTVAPWQFLTGDPAAIEATTRAVGFEYAYDAQQDLYAHPAGLVIIAPGGTISRYLFDVGPQMPDLKLALLEAGAGELGSFTDQVLLRCYRFDPETGRYTVAVVGLLQMLGVAFLLALGALLFWLHRRRP